ncbi:hypothetical protein SDC9_142189 [bioreactor metagenome]|uniref:Uncharacterized protein n=1 Tax=bioreactor metagenome TaxID=1076179 RepID=A0A645E0Z2_9ZZZZ
MNGIFNCVKVTGGQQIGCFNHGIIALSVSLDVGDVEVAA